MAPDLAAIARRPDWLPHRIDLANDLVELVPADGQAVRAAAFLDGRSAFHTGASRIGSFSAWLGAAGGAGPARIIFHIGFCGSTLLSRLIDQPGRTLVLREPQAITDLATCRAERDRSGGDADGIARDARRLAAILCRPWREGEAAILKPTNWINNLAPDLCAAGADVRPIFLTAGRENFVRAVLRGGAERIAFVARAAAHWSTRGRDNAEMLAAALARKGDDATRLATIAAVAHEMQHRLLRDAAAAGGRGAEHVMTFEDLLAAPVATALRAGALLDVTLSEAELASAAERWAGRHAKAPGEPYSRAAERQADAGLAAREGRLIAEALDWADRMIGPPTPIAPAGGRGASR